MSLGRRKIGVHQTSRWVFNRMADVYDARPAYPGDLVAALAALVVPAGGRVADLGAGIGHLALPLSELGLQVLAVEPAHAMAERLRAAAEGRRLPVEVHHAAAEALPIPPTSLDMVVVADALHFMDAQLTAGEIARVLKPGGVLALVSCEFATTDFMSAVWRVVKEAVPRRPRDLVNQMVHLSAVTGVEFTGEQRFHDETPVDHLTLDRILRSISFIGPAMNPVRLAAFRQRIHAIPDAPIWARRFTLKWGRRRRPLFVDGADLS